MRYPSELVKNLHPAKDGWKESPVEIHDENKPNAYNLPSKICFVCNLAASSNRYVRWEIGFPLILSPSFNLLIN